MDRQEAVQKLSKVARISVAYAEDLYDSFLPKPAVPQYVADWYEEHKDEFEINLYREVCRSEENYERCGLTDFQEWLISSKTSSFSVLANMHQFGYEVEKERRYTVRVKGIKGTNRWLVFGELVECWWFDGNGGMADVRTQHTRKELESDGFGWVFDCEGIEIEEVD